MRNAKIEIDIYTEMRNAKLKIDIHDTEYGYDCIRGTNNHNDK